MSRNILVVAPHADDETLGPGGSLLRHADEGDEIFWLIMTNKFEKDGFPKDDVDARNKEIERVAECFGFNEIWRLNYSPGKLDKADTIEIIEDLTKAFNSIKPEIVYLPFSNDVHSDHRITSEAVIACSKTFKFPTIRSFRVYETVSQTEFGSNLYRESFHPNLWIDISGFLSKKIEIADIYESEIADHPFPRSSKNIESIASFRGATMGVASAESFIIIKEII